MTAQTHQERDDLPVERAPVPDELHEEVAELIRALAMVAGDHDAVYRCLQDYCSQRTTEPAFAGLAAALVVIFAECITVPTDPEQYAVVALPTD